MNTIEEIELRYKSFEDWKILELAKNPSGLREDVIPILLNEIRIRKLDFDLDWFKHEIHRFNDYEKQILHGKIQNLKCSLCLKNSDLSGYEFNTRISFLISIVHKKEKFIICNECARKKRLKSMIQTFFLGWWSRDGFVSTPVIIILDFGKVFRKKSQSKKIIDEFIENRTGVLRQCHNQDELFEVIGKFNQ